MGSFQDILRRGVFSAGQWVEKAADRLQKNHSAKRFTLEKKRGEPGMPSFTWMSQGDSQQFKTLLAGAERSHLFPLIPDLSQKASLHLTPGANSFVSMLEKRGSTKIIELDVRRNAVNLENLENKTHYFARGAVDKLPFSEESFDFILYPSALEWRSDLSQLIAEVGRCLKPNGRFLLSMVHPIFEYFNDPKRGFRRNLGSIFNELKKSGLFVEELEEISLNNALQVTSIPTGLQEELRPFYSVPLLLLIRGIQIRKRK